MIRQTSIDCYNQIKEEGLLSKRRLEVYEAIFKKAPCTTNEAMQGHFSGSHGIGSRTTELKELGVIKELGTRECKVTGRTVIEWDLTDMLPVKKEVVKEDKRITIAEAEKLLNRQRKVNYSIIRPFEQTKLEL